VNWISFVVDQFVEISLRVDWIASGRLDRSSSQKHHQETSQYPPYHHLLVTLTSMYILADWIMDCGPTDNRSSHPTPPESPRQLPQSPNPIPERPQRHPPPTSPRSTTSHPFDATKRGSPAVEAALQLLRDHRACKLTAGTTQEVDLDLSEYRTLLRRLDKDSDLKGYVENKIRYVWVVQVWSSIIRRNETNQSTPLLGLNTAPSTIF